MIGKKWVGYTLFNIIVNVLLYISLKLCGFNCIAMSIHAVMILERAPLKCTCSEGTDDLASLDVSDGA